MEILNDCAQIIKTTDNPDVFFSRYALYSDTLKELADAELAGIKFEGDSPLNKQITVLNDKEKTNTTNEMIVRYYNKIVNKINTLKTDSAKSNNALKFRDYIKNGWFEAITRIWCWTAITIANHSYIFPLFEEKCFTL